MNSQRQYKKLEDLSDSDEEIHPNIDTKSYRKFIKDLRETRFEELKSKENLTIEEHKELETLEYKFLPVVKEVSESSFRISKESKSALEDYSEDLGIMINLFTVDFFIDYIDKKKIKLKVFEELVDLNLIEQIKCDNDEIGLILCKIALCTRWLIEFGSAMLVKIGSNQDKFEKIIQEHYKSSKKAILELENK